VILDRAPDRFTTREQLPLPSKPPYTAHLGNLPFDATQGDVEEYFQGCEPTNVRIVEDKIEHKPKGFGYVEFRTLDGLKKALTLDGTQFRGRNIRISVAEPRKYRKYTASALILTKNEAKDRPEARELNDWTRKGPLPDLPQQRRVSDRSGFKGYEAAPEMERGGSRRGAPSFEGDGKVRDFNNWERKGPLTSLPPPAGAQPVREGGRVRDGPPRERKLSPSWGEGRDDSHPPRGEFRERPQQVEKQPTPAELDNQWRARMRPDPPVKSSNTPTPEPSAPSSPAQPPPAAVRPKLNLQKRTVSEAEPTAAAAATSTDSKSSPFGAARPIDTAAREREVEEKRQLQIRLKKEAEEKAREEKKAKEAAAKAAAAIEQASSPVQENGKTHEEPKENGTGAPVPGRNYQILSRVDDEGNEIENEREATDEPTNGEVIEDKPVKSREFIREPPKGPKAQQHGGSWRRKPSTSNTPTSPSGPTTVEEEGWSTVPTRGKGGRGRGGNAGARAIAS